jgi:hypothetical protein
MAAVGRVQLYAMTGVVGPVYASKRLFTRLDFQSDKGLEPANSRLQYFVFWSRLFHISQVYKTNDG